MPCKDKPCVGPFPYTTGSLQLVSKPLANLIAASVPARRNIDDAEWLSQQPGKNGSERKNPAYEDVWLGYCIRNLLPSDTRVATVSLDKWFYYFDREGWMMMNTTMLMHNRMKHTFRIHAAHEAMHRYHCKFTNLLTCSKPVRYLADHSSRQRNDGIPELHQGGKAGAVVYDACAITPDAHVRGRIQALDLKRACRWSGPERLSNTTMVCNVPG